MSNRLPAIFGDLNNWGTILNNYLGTSHKSDGTDLDGGFRLKTYGAAGDGVTDDTTAVTNWINAVNSAGGGWMVPGPGNFKVTSTLPTVSVPIRMIGNGPGINFVGATQFTFSAGVPGFQLGGNSTPNASPTVIEGIALAGSDSSNGQGTVGTNHGISMAAATAHAHGSIVRNVVITGFGGNGIDWEASSGNAIASSFDTVRIANCNGHGMKLVGQNVSVSQLYNVDIGNCGLYGFYNNAPGCTFTGCQIANCSQQPGRTVTDAVTNGTTTLTSATANFVSTDRGQVVTGTNIASNTSIASVTNSTTVVLNQAATGSGSGGTLTILNGGAVYDTTEGSIYINTYVEGGLGSNVNFDVGASGGTWIGGNWTSAWFSNGKPYGWSLLNGGGGAPQWAQIPQLSSNLTVANGVGSIGTVDNIQFKANSGPALVLDSPGGSFPSLQWVNVGGTQLAITGNTASALIDIGQSGGNIRFRNHSGVNQILLGDTGIWTYASTTGGTNSGTSASAITPTFANGTAGQLSDTGRDYEVYLVIGTAGSAFTIAIGPTSGVANTVVSSVTPTAGNLYTVRVPAGWYLKWSGSSTTIATQFALSC